MNKHDIVERIIGGRRTPAAAQGKGIAPANIALVKYWGKRDEALNLPVTSSLSVSLGHLGTTTTLEPIAGADEILLNGLPVPEDTTFARRLHAYLDFFRPEPTAGYRVITRNTIPTAAGLASSASGYAALALALNDLHRWGLAPRDLSILARLGSGSASRSIFTGLVRWNAGAREDGMDSFAEPIPLRFPGLRIGLIKVSVAEKAVSSRDAMKQTVAGSPLYRAWPDQVTRDLDAMLAAFQNHDMEALGRTAENNALAMHATAVAAWPPTLFWLPESVKAMHEMWRMRAEGLPVYFTMDAGPNLKVLTAAEHTDTVDKQFPGVEWVDPFPQHE
ncbi:MAG TPA: diphosphomevalonate decarboxylase [Kiritimatiellia bacterium]|nr:diphosphomevalonate decarboxylase [Kiritimatiellia bacterium]HMO99156.1 diphosphomevalonate decarboxylase [Kiritimatiellia bacterium]HMP95666.1 diphosphomevalonate decarboxylase [Kiritimatiellia bacterium]